MSAPVSKVPALTPFDDELCCLGVREINPFRPELVLILVFHHINETLTKTELEIISLKITHCMLLLPALVFNMSNPILVNI